MNNRQRILNINVKFIGVKLTELEHRLSIVRLYCLFLLFLPHIVLKHSVVVNLPLQLFNFVLFNDQLCVLVALELGPPLEWVSVLLLLLIILWPFGNQTKRVLLQIVVFHPVVHKRETHLCLNWRVVLLSGDLWKKDNKAFWFVRSLNDAALTFSDEEFILHLSFVIEMEFILNHAVFVNFFLEVFITFSKVDMCVVLRILVRLIKSSDDLVAISILPIDA